MTRPSIYDFAGGEPAFLALAEAMHARCLADPVLNHPFSRADQNPEHLANLAAYWAEVFGGPPAYSQRLGGQSGMLRIHAGNGMEASMGERFRTCFLQALDDAHWPGDPELRAVLKDYMTDAVAEIDKYNPPGSAVPDGQAVPRWSWSGRVS